MKDIKQLLIDPTICVLVPNKWFCTTAASALLAYNLRQRTNKDKYDLSLKLDKAYRVNKDMKFLNLCKQFLK